MVKAEPARRYHRRVERTSVRSALRQKNPGPGGSRTIRQENDEVPVSEIFFSVQGEGIHSGTPSVFLRTFYCNLTCAWCDTKYTWLNQNVAEPGVHYELMKVEVILQKIVSFGCKHLVITGGEPLLHQNLLVPLISRLKASCFFVEIETNGTIAPTEKLLEQVDCFNVSPKIGNSLVQESVRIRPGSLQGFVLSDKAWFKFVVRDPDDLVEIDRLMSAQGIPRERVLLMPEGIDAATISERSRWLVEICKERGFRFTPRLHIMLFGNARGK
jgi:7-carboxy-7-deazaguanine synthase